MREKAITTLRMPCIDYYFHKAMQSCLPKGSKCSLDQGSCKFNGEDESIFSHHIWPHIKCKTDKRIQPFTKFSDPCEPDTGMSEIFLLNPNVKIVLDK